MISRRFFIGSCFAASASVGYGKLKAAVASKPIAKIGVLSDVHLKVPGDEDTFLKALEYFRDNGADGVLVAGDIADTGKISELKRAADAWFKIFPEGKAPDGRKVEQLFVLGNHDSLGWRGGLKGEQLNDPAVVADALGYSLESLQKAWMDCFHEEFSPIWMKDVNGIAVIGTHWGLANDHDKVMEKFFAENGKRLNPNLPFIYTQHTHPRNTCMGAWAWGHDNGTATRVLSQYPNAVAFSGHSHYSLTDERSVWQGEFTSINTSSLRQTSLDYACRENARGNRYGYREDKRRRAMRSLDTRDGRQGMLVSIFADRLEIVRREFVYGESLGPDWIVPLPARTNGPLAFQSRAAKRSAPEFAIDAEIRVCVKEPQPGKKCVEVSFPSAHAVDGCRVNEYEVTATLVEDDFDLIQAQRRFLAADFYLPNSQCGKKNTCVFSFDELPQKGRYVFSVRPIECFGKKGAERASKVFRIR